MTKSMLSVIACGLVTGCSSLEQSALVYTSTISVGAGFELDAQGTGFDATLGYKQNDLAYVPVAVSEKEKETDKLNIEKSLEQSSWTIISGYSDGPSSSTSSGTITTNNSEAENIDNEPGSQSAELQKLELKQEQLQKEIAEHQGDSESKKQLQENLQEIQESISNINSHESSYGEGLTDAFSVYGSFNSTSSGAPSGVGIDLGRTFSTGVAAQKLAAAVQTSAKATYAETITSCITALNSAITKGKSDEEIAQISPDIYNICKK